MARPGVCPGGHRQQACRRDPYPGHRCRHRAGRRGRQDHLLRQRHRAAHERHLRRRYGRLHRPDGNPAAHRRERPQRARGQRHHHLSNRQPLRRLCQDRRPAAAQRRRPPRGRGGLHLPGCRDPDYLGPGVRPSHPRQRRLPGRPAAVSLRATPPLLPHAQPGRGAPYRAPKRPPVCGERRRHGARVQ